MAAGRPSKFKKKYCKMIREFFDVEPVRVLIKEDGSEEKSIDLPTFQKFASLIGVHTDTLENWCRDYPEFKTAYEYAKMMQTHVWLINGLNGVYSAQFAKFFGINCLGFRDEKQIANAPSGPFRVDGLDAGAALEALGYHRDSGNDGN